MTTQNGLLSGKRVLLAEDDHAARRALAGALRSLGMDVLEVADGGRMLVAVTSQYRGDHSPREIDLVVTDVRMPVMSGLDIFKGIRAAHWRMPVIVMTAYETPEVRDVVDRYGATLITKPIDLDELERTIRDLLAPHR
jgi:CheY-like chemotaxis protein